MFLGLLFAVLTMLVGLVNLQFLRPRATQSTMYMFLFVTYNVASYAALAVVCFRQHLQSQRGVQAKWQEHRT